MNSATFVTIIEVAISMVYVWLVLSAVTVSVLEGIAAQLKWRAKEQEEAIRILLGGPLWAEQLYAHPLIQGPTKLVGRKPSDIPANKFALALLDIVMTSGMQESFLQRKLLAAKLDSKKAPNQLVPFLVYIINQVRRGIRRFNNHILHFFGSRKGTPDQKYTVLLEIMQNFAYSNDPGKFEDVTQIWRVFFKALLSDETNIDGKTLSTPSLEFMEVYPLLREFFYDSMQIILDKQPILKQRWAEIIISSNEKLAEKINDQLAEGDTLREKLREQSEAYAEKFEIREENLDSITMCARQTLDEIHFVHMIDYAQKLNGGSTQGMDALQTLNPTLYKRLSQLYADLIGIATNEKIAQDIRAKLTQGAFQLDDISSNFVAMRINIETWFNESMNQLSSWFTRRATRFAFLIGIILASLFNIDSVHIAKYLWEEEAVRQELVVAAQQYSEDTGQSVGWNIPLGWTTEDVPGDGIGWFTKGVGIAISAWAASQGTHFWLAFLKNLISVLTNRLPTSGKKA